MPANPVASTSAASDLIDSRVSSAQVDKAVHALVAHATKQATEASKTELLDRDDHVWLTIGTKKISSVKKLKPAKMWVQWRVLLAGWVSAPPGRLRLFGASERAGPHLVAASRPTPSPLGCSILHLGCSSWRKRDRVFLPRSFG